VELAAVEVVARRLAALGTALLLAGVASAWLLAAEYRERAPAGAFAPRERPPWPLSPTGAAHVRADALRRARVRLAMPPVPAIDLDIVEPALACRFIARAATGTTPKFDCALESGEVIKVKYGRNPELPGEVAATRLISALGFASDRMSIARVVRCYGCPRSPFMAMRLLQVTGMPEWPPVLGTADGYSEFSWAAVERKFDAYAIELPERAGWGWWELKYVDPREGSSREDLDALRLLAVFLAHWDNKDENQRLACLDMPGAVDAPCARPVALLQDVGATFGPIKVNLARWATTPVWADRATCTVSMKALPYGGGTFPDARIGDTARRQLARQLAAIPRGDVRALFAAARFPQHYSSTDDERDLDAWEAAFTGRVRQIAEAGPCPQ
jgi:hypothetical protein